MIKKMCIYNYKIFRSFELDFNKELNIIVGDNEVGKSTILEAVNLVLTKRLNGSLIDYELTPFLFNKDCEREYLESISIGKPRELPKIVIELYLDENPELEDLRGSMNSRKEDCEGIKIEIVFDEEFSGEYKNFIEHGLGDIRAIPVEYYKINWYSFANNPINPKRPPIRLSYIDATMIRLQSGTDYYLQDIIRNGLDAKERVGLSVAYRKLKEEFSQQDSIKGINEKLTNKKGAITEKDLAISIDISQKSNWEAHLVPHLNDLPFQFVGRGEQSALKIMLALERKGGESKVILIEEPENHLSFSSMNKLIGKIKDKCIGKQILITTHSAYVLNKLGLEYLILLQDCKTVKLTDLAPDTLNYFKKLPGYDTLRLVLAKKAILVEGPSDELVVQKAYLQKHKRLPIDDGVDVINVRGLSFHRFLDIAEKLNKITIVVTDNDGDYKIKVDEKYSEYKASSCIKICRSTDNAAPTLEPQLIKSNGLQKLNELMHTNHKTEENMKVYMENNKTECALRIFETTDLIQFPQYIEDAIQ